MTPAEIIEHAIEASSLTAEQVASLPPTAEVGIGAALWKLRAEVPGFPGLVVFALFEGSQHDLFEDHSRGEARAYCIPDPDNPNPEAFWVDAVGETHEGAPHCMFTLSRLAPTHARKDWPSAEAFAEEIASEWDDLATLLGIVDDDDAERDAKDCAVCGHATEVVKTGEEEDENVHPSYCGHCGQPLAPTTSPAPVPS